MLDLGEAQTGVLLLKGRLQTRTKASRTLSNLLIPIVNILEESGLLEERRRERARTEMVEMIHDRISRHVMEDIVQTGKFADYVEQVYERENDPFTVVDSIVGNIFK